MDSTSIPNFNSPFPQNAHMRLACRLHPLHPRRANCLNDGSAGFGSPAGTDLDVDGERICVRNRWPVLDHGCGFAGTVGCTRTLASAARYPVMIHVTFDKVSKAFDGRLALAEFSIEIEKGERLVLFGPSGCGKTTILRLLSGLDVPDKGSIRIDGTVVAREGKNLIMPETRNVGMVFQDLALWPHMTVRENLMFGLRARRVSIANADQRIGEMLRSVGLESRAEAMPDQLSGGEQQRVALTRALVLRSPILLMDEPLSSLDDERKQKIVEDLIRLHNQFGFTLVYVTHDKTEANMLASRICVMREGQLSAIQNVSNLSKKI
jgi:iron(III) transport system ATP-binding protein